MELVPEGGRARNCQGRRALPRARISTSAQPAPARAAMTSSSSQALGGPARRQEPRVGVASAPPAVLQPRL
eukprot:15471754-Alexandrium_andersonii.AAC.1